MRALVALVLAGCSYSPSFGDCEVLCNAPDHCPSGYTCNQEGRCRAPGTAGNCNDVLGDARRDSSGPDDDAPPGAQCTGTVTACVDLTSSATCGAQNGCGWSAPTCTVTTNCNAIATNQECETHPECATDFAGPPYCVKNPGYCNGTTEPQCESKATCLFTNGCSGTAAGCGEFTEEVACDEQAGCSWSN
ncbi:MAG TPA: hypothetical protein VIU61_24595 [Kofleriaceae bacterium]